MLGRISAAGGINELASTDGCARLWGRLDASALLGTYTSMDFIQLVEQSSFMVWLREGGSLWGYPAILFAHTLGLGTVAGVNGVVDLRILGFGRRIPLSSLLSVFPISGTAFAVTVVSGLILLGSDAANKLAAPVFYVKMLFVILALLCTQQVKRVVAAGDGAEASGRIWALGSIACWAGAITAGRLMAYLGSVSGLG